MGLTFIASRTADEPGTGSGEATLGFTSGIDDTYNEYQFYFVNIHPDTQVTTHPNFQFQVNAITSADPPVQLEGFDENMTTTGFYAYNRNTSGASDLTYGATEDQAGTDAIYQNILAYDITNVDRGSVSGVLTLYDPSSITYIKHFTSVGQGIAYGNAPGVGSGSYALNMWNAGYINTTNAITQISFKFDDGDIDAGTIYMYGVS